MNTVAERVYQETGKRVSYVMGTIQVRGKDGRVRNVNGVISGDNIVVRADHLRLSMEQIADHESYHSHAMSDQSLNRTLRRYIVQQYSQQEFNAVMQKYMEALRGVYDVDDLQTGEAFAQLQEMVLEEVLADAYAGINAFGTNADRFTDAVREKMEQRGYTRYQSQENGVRETNGPPMSASTAKENTADVGGERFSVDEEHEANEYIAGDVSENEIQTNIETIARMEAVAQIEADTFKMGDGRLLTDVTAFFDPVGGSAYNERLGKVYLRKHGVKNDLGHGMSDEKTASFAAIPDVVRKGKVAAFVKNKDNKGYDSATVIAPIKIGTTPYMMGVIVHRSNNENRFYVHDVFNIKEEVAPLITGTHNVGESGGATSTISIFKKILEVKRKNASSEILTDEEFQAKYGLKLRAVDEHGKGANSQAVENAREEPVEMFSVDDASDEDFATVQAAMNAQSKEWNEMYLRNRWQTSLARLVVDKW